MHRRSDDPHEWETAAYFAPRKGALDAAAAGELSLDLLGTEDDCDDQVSDLAAADDQEAQALSGGRLGRQHRDGSNGTVRKQVFRGNPEAANASASEQISAGFDFLIRREEREMERAVREEEQHKQEQRRERERYEEERE
ncbi:unnamed protein product [Ectocarpus sp. 8 AP-2014]